MGDHAAEIIDGHSFPMALGSAVELKWSGTLNAMKDSQQVGLVVLRDGNVAWAVSNSQTENFASFLERIGMVPKDRLDEVLLKYRSLGKSKKLGALLEETGLISRTMVRECLKAHVSAAISSMMADSEIILKARGGEMVVDTSLIFRLSEVYPALGEESLSEGMSQVPEDSVAMVENEESLPEERVILQDLAALPGYRYSVVSDTEGNQFAYHMAEGVSVDTKQLLPSILVWREASTLSSNELKIGKVLFGFVQSEFGSLFVHMIDTESSYFLAVVCDEKAKLGVFRHKMSELIPEVRKLTEMQ